MTAIDNQQEKLRKMQDHAAHNARMEAESKANQLKEHTFDAPVTTNDVMKSQIGKK